MIEGLFHVHSDYSSDGRSSLVEIERLCSARNFRFAFIADHSEDLSDEKFTDLKRECAALSSDKLLLIPGIEFSFEDLPGLHLLGVGMEEFITPLSVEDAIEGIQCQGGLVILAHPSRLRSRISKDDLCKLDGIEVWNAVYDSRYLPDRVSFKLYHGVRKYNGSIKAFAGLDMHWTKTFQDLVLHMETVEEPNREVLLAGLRKGQFHSRGPCYKLRSTPRYSVFTRAVLNVGRLAIEGLDRFYRIFKNLFQKREASL